MCRFVSSHIRCVWVGTVCEVQCAASVSVASGPEINPPHTSTVVPERALSLFQILSVRLKSAAESNSRSTS